MTSLGTSFPLFALALLASSAVACGGGAYPPVSQPSLLASSSYSSSSFSGPSAPSIPQHDNGRHDLVVRPDLVCVPFVLRLETTDPTGQLGVLEKATAVIGETFGAATNHASTAKMLGASVTPLSSASKFKDDKPQRFVVIVDGSIETPLASEAAYWARAKLVAGLVQASGTAVPLLAPAKEGDPEVDVAFGAPEIKLKDPEAYRADLMKRWVERARAFSKIAEDSAAPLHLVSCEPPGAITMSAMSVEQVGLSLPVSCRIDVARKTD